MASFLYSPLVCLLSVFLLFVCFLFAYFLFACSSLLVLLIECGLLVYVLLVCVLLVCVLLVCVACVWRPFCILLFVFFTCFLLVAFILVGFILVCVRLACAQLACVLVPFSCVLYVCVCVCPPYGCVLFVSSIIAAVPSVMIKVTMPDFQGAHVPVSIGECILNPFPAWRRLLLLLVVAVTANYNSIHPHTTAVVSILTF